MKPNLEYMNNLKGWLVDVAVEAVKSARPAKIGYGLGHAEIGYNRRMCWENGSHTMYGNIESGGFTGLEGPNDPLHAVLYAVDKDNKIIGILHNNCSHATCLEQGNFASADFPGSARMKIRDILNTKVPVLYLQGASGDTSPTYLLKRMGPYEEYRLQLYKKTGNILAGETIRIIEKTKPVDDLIMRSGFENLTVGVRIPAKEQLKYARAIIKKGAGKENRWKYVLQAGVLRLYEEFKNKPYDNMPVHALRIGDLGIVTNTTELYCQLGLNIKRRSPAKITVVSELTNGVSSYCSTIESIMGGGYSGDPTYWARFDPFAGYKIVDTSCKLLYNLWK